MLFSIIVPVYNVEKYIHECIESIINQNFNDYEIILVDDGSTDNSGKICDAYRVEYPDRIRVIHKKNEGLLLTRRCGIRNASGEWFVHLDSDDYMLPGVLEKLSHTIKEMNPDLIICKIAYGAKDGSSVDFYSKLSFQDEEVFDNEKKHQLYYQFLVKGYMNAVYQKIAKRSIVDIDTDYTQWGRVSLAEDALQSLPLLTNSTKAVYLDFPVVYYRYNPLSITKKSDFFSYERNITSLLDVYKEEYRYYDKWNLSKKTIGEAEAKHAKRICNQIKQMMKSMEIYEKNGINDFFIRLKKDSTWIMIFAKADDSDVGRFCKVCYALIKYNKYRMLYYFCKFFK